MGEIQAKAEPTETTATEILPETVETAAGSLASTTNNPGEINWDEVDDATYLRLAAEELANQHKRTGETAGNDGFPTDDEPEEPEQVSEVPEVPAAAETITPPEDDIQSVPGKSFRPRLDGLPDAEKEAIALRKQLGALGQNVSLMDCLNRVNAKYGITADGKPPEATQQQVENQPSSADIKANITALRADYKAAAQSVDTVRMAEIQEQIEDARDSLTAATQRESQTAVVRQTQQQTVEQKRNADIAASKVTARAAFPDLAKSDSPMAKQWHIVHKRMVEQGDPAVNSVNAPHLISVIAASEIGVVPVKGKVVSSAAPASRNPVNPAPGSSRSSVGSTQNTGQLEAKLNAARSVDDYQKVLEEAGLSQE